ncbi:MAG: glycosyltransferase family 39 protein, partial [Actinobacteria bacterium]|nr:glycosyltransferase family 39 protein [Actinomycetota bacterium]
FMYNFFMGFVRRHASDFLIGFVIVTVFLILRSTNLSIIPIFTDEAIYMRWAQIALNDASWRFISLTDGKQPLFIWASMVLMKFVEDPLMAGRIISVISGFFTMIGLWFLSFELFKNKKVAFLSSLLYVFYPFAQVYDRMAMMDSMVGAFAVWALYIAIRIVRKVNLGYAYTLGFVISGGILTKSSDFFSMYLLPFTLLLFDFKSKNKVLRLSRVILLLIVSVVVAEILYNVLRLSPFFAVITQKNALFVYPISEWLTHPFTFFEGNIRGLLTWLFTYLGYSYIGLILLSLIFIKKFPKEKLLLIAYFLFPFTALALFGRVIFPRFIFFMSLFLLPLAALSLDQIVEFYKSKITNKFTKNIIQLLIIILILGYPSYSISKLLYDPINAPIANSDSDQYINNWTAGYGVNETIDFLKKESKDKKIFVGTEGTFGLMPYSLELYLVQNKNIIIKGYWPVDDKFPQEAIDLSKKMPSYFIFYQPQHQTLSSNFKVNLIFKRQQGKSDYYYRLYKIIP